MKRIRFDLNVQLNLTVELDPYIKRRLLWSNTYNDRSATKQSVDSVVSNVKLYNDATTQMCILIEIGFTATY